MSHLVFDWDAEKADVVGNGGIMRLAPAVLAFHDNLEQAMHVSQLQSRTTHQVQGEGCH